jgi:hypothetical protein
MIFSRVRFARKISNERSLCSQRRKYSQVLRRDVQNLPKLRFLFPDFALLLLAILNIDTQSRKLSPLANGVRHRSTIPSTSSGWMNPVHFQT